MTRIIFATHRELQCGVHQFGKQIFEALHASSRFDFIYCEVSSPSELRGAVLTYDPAAVIINYHPSTIGWAAGFCAASLQVPTIGLMHEMTAQVADRTDDTLFDYYIFHDPSAAAEMRNPLFFTASRLINVSAQQVAPPARFTVGSFGFATPGKGFEAVAARAHAEFDDCLIRFNIPASDFCDKDGSEAHRVAERCRSLIVKPGVQIEITHDFMDLDGVKEFLAGNSINAFFYDDQEGRGLSSAIDLALSVRRPIALRRTAMVRHLFMAEPSIFIEDRSLKEIADSGLIPLQPFIERWSASTVREEYETMLESVLSRETPQLAKTRWYKRASQMEAQERALQESEAAARQALIASEQSASAALQAFNDELAQMRDDHALAMSLELTRAQREAIRSEELIASLRWVNTQANELIGHCQQSFLGQLTRNASSARRPGSLARLLAALRDTSAVQRRSEVEHAILASGLFDETFYLRTYPDVASSGMDALTHYCLHGRKEGRRPHPMFDDVFYLATNPDVREADVNPLLHFVQHGFKEGRKPNPLV